MGHAQQEELFIPGPERDMGFAINVSEIAHLIEEAGCRPSIPFSSDRVVREMSLALQQAFLECDPVVQKILAGHERYRSLVAAKSQQLRVELETEFRDYDVRDDY